MKKNVIVNIDEDNNGYRVDMRDNFTVILNEHVERYTDALSLIHRQVGTLLEIETRRLQWATQNQTDSNLDAVFVSTEEKQTI